MLIFLMGLAGAILIAAAIVALYYLLSVPVIMGIVVVLLLGGLLWIFGFFLMDWILSLIFRAKPWMKERKK